MRGMTCIASIMHVRICYECSIVEIFFGGMEGGANSAAFDASSSITGYLRAATKNVASTVRDDIDLAKPPSEPGAPATEQTTPAAAAGSESAQLARKEQLAAMFKLDGSFVSSSESAKVKVLLKGAKGKGKPGKDKEKEGAKDKEKDSVSLDVDATMILAMPKAEPARWMQAYEGQLLKYGLRALEDYHLSYATLKWKTVFSTALKMDSDENVDAAILLLNLDDPANALVQDLGFSSDDVRRARLEDLTLPHLLNAIANRVELVDGSLRLPKVVARMIFIRHSGYVGEHLRTALNNIASIDANDAKADKTLDPSNKELMDALAWFLEPADTFKMDLGVRAEKFRSWFVNLTSLEKTKGRPFAMAILQYERQFVKCMSSKDAISELVTFLSSIPQISRASPVPLAILSNLASKLRKITTLSVLGDEHKGSIDKAFDKYHEAQSCHISMFRDSIALGDLMATENLVSNSIDEVNLKSSADSSIAIHKTMQNCRRFRTDAPAGANAFVLSAHVVDEMCSLDSQIATLTASVGKSKPACQFVGQVAYDEAIKEAQSALESASTLSKQCHDWFDSLRMHCETAKGAGAGGAFFDQKTFLEWERKVQAIATAGAYKHAAFKISDASIACVLNDAAFLAKHWFAATEKVMLLLTLN
jgi:hypothetical protein